MKDSATKEAPVKTFQVFPVEVSIWRSTVGHYSVGISRSYKDPNSGAWAKANSLYGSDLLVAADLLKRAYEWIINAAPGSSESLRVTLVDKNVSPPSRRAD